MPDPIDEMGVADTQAQQEPPGERLLQGALGVGHGDGVAGVDVGDAGGHLQCRRGRQQQGGGDERVAAHGLRDPQRREAEGLEVEGGLLGVGRRDAVERPRPDTDAAEIECLVPHGARKLVAIYSAWGGPKR